MVKQFRGFEVPIEPKKEWKDWMCDPGKVCPLGAKGGLNCPKPGLLCHHCIYAYISAVPRKAFYEHCFPSKPKTLPKRDSKGRFCKKEQKGSVNWYFQGLCVPVKPKESWTWMLEHNRGCFLDECNYEQECKSCVYSFANADTRAAFFIDCFGGVKKELSLPKLTAEVFDREDCPKWARYAVVAGSGEAYFYSTKPTISFGYWGSSFEEETLFMPINGSPFDASDWKNSLIERPKKFPNYSDWQLWDVRVSPSTHRVIRKIPGYEATKVRFEEKGNSTVFTVEPEDLPWDLVPVKITLLPPEDLIGKTVVDLLGNYTTVIGISENKDRISVYNIDRGKIENLPLKFFFFEYRLPNGLYVASIEKA